MKPKKSSLKTFLKGKNPVDGVFLKGTRKNFNKLLHKEECHTSFSFETEDDIRFNIDILDYGTAITYSPNN